MGNRWGLASGPLVPRYRWTAFVPLVTVWFSASVYAGDESAEPLQEVTVTAERREENLQKASLTIQVLDAQEVQRAGLSDATDLSRVTTGVEVGVGGVSDQIFIRGVGSFAYSPLSAPGVAFNVDGVYVGRPDGIGANFYDIARVEVLKGPQGTLYGRNANGGAINVI